MLLSILVYVFLDTQQEYEDPGGGQPEFREFNLILISSCLQFEFVNAIPKFLNIATFSEGLLANYVLFSNYQLNEHFLYSLTIYMYAG